jgi:hypothetical protein
MATLLPPEGVYVSSATEYISALLRAANRLDEINDFERRRLLYKGVLIIQDMRKGVSIPESAPSKEALSEFESVSEAIILGWASDTQVKDALLQAARVIRDLHIALDTRA